MGWEETSEEVADTGTRRGKGMALLGLKESMTVALSHSITKTYPRFLYRQEALVTHVSSSPDLLEVLTGHLYPYPRVFSSFMGLCHGPEDLLAVTGVERSSVSMIQESGKPLSKEISPWSPKLELQIFGGSFFFHLTK